MEQNAIRIKARVHYGYIHNAGDIMRVGEPFSHGDLDNLVRGGYAAWIDEEAEAKGEAAPTKETGPANPVGARSNAAPIRPASDTPFSCNIIGCTAKVFQTEAALNAHKAQKHAGL